MGQIREISRIDSGLAKCRATNRLNWRVGVSDWLTSSAAVHLGIERIRCCESATISTIFASFHLLFLCCDVNHLTMSLLATFVVGRIPFAFLEDIHGRFVKTYGRAALTALAYAMNDEFSRVLSQQMDYYSNDPNADRINRMRGEIDQVLPFTSCYYVDFH